MPEIVLTDEELSKARNAIDPDLLEERTLREKLLAIRDETGETNGSLAQRLRENKRTFESWVGGGEGREGRFIPEGEKLKKVNSLLLYVSLLYVDKTYKQQRTVDAYKDFSKLFLFLDFNDAVSTLSSYLAEKGKRLDYTTGQIS